MGRGGAETVPCMGVHETPLYGAPFPEPRLLTEMEAHACPRTWDPGCGREALSWGGSGRLVDS